MRSIFSAWAFLIAFYYCGLSVVHAETQSPFEPDYTNFLLGKAFKGPDKIIWGDILSPKDVQFLKFENAKKHCEYIGAELPTAEDFEALRQHIRVAKSGKVQPREWNDFIPNLTYDCRLPYRFSGSRETHYNYTACSWEFWTADGNYTQIYPSGSSPVLHSDRSVRCIRRPSGKYKKISYSDTIAHHNHRSRPIIGTLQQVKSGGAVIKIKSTTESVVLENLILQITTTNIVELKCQTEVCASQLENIQKGEKVLAVSAKVNEWGHEFLAAGVYPLKQVNLIETNSYTAAENPVNLSFRSKDPVVIFVHAYDGIRFELEGDTDQFIAAFVKGFHGSNFENVGPRSVNTEQVGPWMYQEGDLLESLGLSSSDFKKTKSFGYTYTLPGRLKAEF